MTKPAASPAIEYVDTVAEGFKLKLPKQLRQTKKLPLFRGRVTGCHGTVELIVTIGPATSNHIEEALRASSWKPPELGEWKGATWHYRQFGPSVTRPGGSEVSCTHVAPVARGPLHRWTLVFPTGDAWVHLDIATLRGDASWEEFEAIAVQIIRSVEV